MNKTILTTSIGLVALGGAGFVTDARINEYTDRGHSFEMPIAETLRDAGQSTVFLSKTEPKMTLSKWNGQATLGIKYAGVNSNGARSAFTNRVEWKQGKTEVHAYPVSIKDGVVTKKEVSLIPSANAQMIGEEGFEFEVVWNEEPSTTTVEFQLEGWENFNFYKQPVLTQEDMDSGTVRADNIVNSFAVYHKNKRDYKIGSVNYGTGKFGHIYRLKAIDANGDWTWVDAVSYENGLITATVDPVWASTASYPVTVDPTFGNTSVGASSITALAADDIYALVASAPADGTVTQIDAYLAALAGHNWKGVLTTQTGLTIVANGVGGADAVDTDVWNSSTGMNATITNGTSYLIGWISDFQGGFYYDVGASGSSYRDTSNDYATPQDWGSSSARTEIISIYATYTAAGGGGGGFSDGPRIKVWEE